MSNEKIKLSELPDRTLEYVVGVDSNGDAGKQVAPSSGVYLKYIANLNQNGINNPVATELENTLGVVNWSYLSDGFFQATCTNAFPDATKVFFIIQGNKPNAHITSLWNDANSMQIYQANPSDVITGINGMTNVSVEIRVYK